MRNTPSCISHHSAASLQATYNITSYYILGRTSCDANAAMEFVKKNPVMLVHVIVID